MEQKPITVLIKAASHFPVSRAKIREAVVTRLAGFVKRKTEVSVLVVGDRQMRSLNLKYRKLDATTDVLSFPLNESAVAETQFIEPPDDILRLGDIVVSYPQAVREAREENKMVDVKVVELVEHGLNHLLGIHHPE
jgi:probable rRNA maturation factor